MYRVWSVSRFLMPQLSRIAGRTLYGLDRIQATLIPYGIVVKLRGNLELMIPKVL